MYVAISYAHCVLFFIHMDEEQRECPYCGLESEWETGIVRHPEVIHWKQVDANGVQTGASLLIHAVSGWHAVEGRQSDLRVTEARGHSACDCNKMGCGHTSFGNYYKVFERQGWIIA